MKYFMVRESRYMSWQNIKRNNRPEVLLRRGKIPYLIFKEYKKFDPIVEFIPIRKLNSYKS